MTATATGTQVEDTVVTAEAAEAAAIAAFESGFAEGDETPKETPPVEPVGDEPAAPESTPEPVAETPPVEDPPQPKGATITEEQLAKLLETSNSLGDIRSAVDKLRSDAFGRVGGIERVIKALQEDTPAGAAIEVTVDDIKEVSDEYDNLAPLLAKSLTRVLSKMKGTKTVSVPSMSQEEIDQRIEARATEIAQNLAANEGARVQNAMLHNQLSMLHRDWRTVVGPPDSDTEFRRWLKGDPEKEKQALGSYDPFFLGDLITEFKEHKQKAAAKPPKPTGADPRNQRLAEAVPVKGGGGKPPAPRKKTAEEEFNEGFTSDR